MDCGSLLPLSCVAALLPGGRHLFWIGFLLWE